MKKRFRYLLLLSFCLVMVVQAQYVQMTGVTGGMVKSLTLKGDYVFAGIHGNGGLYRSTNNGTTWDVCPGIPTDITVLSVKYVGDDLYCGTQSSNIFKSTDNGNTWTEILGAPVAGTYIQDFATDGTRIYLASNYVCISTDNGATWTRSNTGMTSSGVNKILIKGTKIFVGVDNGVFVSADNGATWAPANTGIDDKRIYSLASDGTALYAGSAYGIYKSVDDGATWVLDNGGIPGNSTVYSLLIQGTKIFAIIYGASIPVYSKELTASTWTASSTGIVGSNGWALASNGTDIFAGGVGSGVHRSNDNGANWTSTNTGLTAARIISMHVDGTNIYVGTNGNSFFKSADEGTTWTQLLAGLTEHNGNGICSNGSSLFAITPNFTFKSINGGTNWSVSKNTGGNCITVKGSSIYVAGWGIVYKSTDDGATWTSSTTGLPSEAAIAIKSNGNDLLILTNTNVFRSTDDGVTWAASVSGLPVNNNLMCITFLNNEVFVGSWGALVYRSQDNGANWIQLGSGSIGNSINSILGFNNTLYAGLTGNNILWSNNLGSTWTNNASGIRNFTFITFLDRNDNYIFAGTYSSGIYRRPISEVIVGIEDKNNRIPSIYTLEQNYPNPFNPSTNIKYSLPEASNVTIKVYDLLGRVVATLVNEYKPAGNYNVNFNASDLASGIYYYQLSSNGSQLLKKMILIK